MSRKPTAVNMNAERILVPRMDPKLGACLDSGNATMNSGKPFKRASHSLGKHSPGRRQSCRLLCRILGMIVKSFLVGLNM